MSYSIPTNENESVNAGWGLETDTKEEIIKAEKVAFGALATSLPERIIRAAPKEVKNMVLVNKTLKLQQEDNIEDGFSFIHMARAVFNKDLKFRRQLIGSCVSSGGRIVDTYRMLAEVFFFNEAQDLVGNEFQGTNSFQPFAPFNYRLGRAIGGLNGYGDGSFCAPHIQGKMQTGFLPCAAKGLQSDAYPEPQNERLYKEWGANDRLVNLFKEQVFAKCTETEKVTSGDAGAELLIKHLKPMQICSAWAFEAAEKHSTWTNNGSPVYIYRRSRQQWAHNMSVVGCVKIKGNWYVLIQNTWGATFHKGNDWFPIPLELFDKWVSERGTACMTVGNFEFFAPHTTAI